MFSLDNFYYILYKNLADPVKLLDYMYYPFGSTNPQDFRVGIHASEQVARMNSVFFIDQEPLMPLAIDGLIAEQSRQFSPPHKFKVLANSEISPECDNFCREFGFHNWYYFFHGFAALEWYRDFQYVPVIDKPNTKVFICLNRLVTKDRSYRLSLVARMLEQDLVKHGLVSCQLEDINGTWKTEVLDRNSNLSRESRRLIAKYIKELPGPLVVDEQVHGWRSAEADIDLQQTALWNVVTETVFYHDKLHLTEKIFKPIVARRPFILVGAAGNLAYLRRYGFKTFGQWIDESYDTETDPDRRQDMIVAELSKLCKLGVTELQQMQADMQEVLDYNFNHFYGDFKRIIVDELVDNFETCCRQYNNGQFPDRKLPVERINFTAVKQRLLR